MKKWMKNMFVVFALILLNTHFVYAAEVTTNPQTDMQTGIMLDCARHYYSVDEIKMYIDTLSERKNVFLHLHFTDDENVGIECETLGQVVEYATQYQDGSYINPDTNKKFLSYEQIQEILIYADNRQVAIVPEIDMPGHMSGFFDLAKIMYGTSYVETIAVNQDEVPGELNISTEEGKMLAEALLTEYAKLFQGCTYFHMGCDEYWTRWGTQMTDFINSQARYLKKYGYIVRMWNDLIKKDNMEQIDHDIEVVYWSYDGATSDTTVRWERIRERASVPDLQEEGFKILITNAYYLYFVPSLRTCETEPHEYRVADIYKNWNLEKWDGNYEGGLASYYNILGAMIGVWGEEADKVSDETIRIQAVDMYHAMVQKVENCSDKEDVGTQGTMEENSGTTSEVDRADEKESTEKATEVAEGQDKTSEPVYEKPSKITGVKKKNVRKRSVKLTWKKQKNVTGYIVYRYNQKSKKYKIYKKTKKNTVNLSGLKRGKLYKFKIRAYRQYESCTIYGLYSKVVKIKKK